MTSHQLDFTSRRIWLGLTIPGKKMMRMLEPIGSVDATIEIVRRNGGLPSLSNLESRPLRQKAEATSGQKLIHMYEMQPWVALHFAALALQAVPVEGARFGPASRDMGFSSMKIYGSILTDVRDFLKLRFRTKGGVDPDEDVPPDIIRALENGDMESVARSDDPKHVFGYIVDIVIGELDNLSRGPNTLADDDILKLRNVLRGMAGIEYPYQSDADTLEEMFD